MRDASSSRRWEVRKSLRGAASSSEAVRRRYRPSVDVSRPLTSWKGGKEGGREEECDKSILLQFLTALLVGCG